VCAVGAYVSALLTDLLARSLVDGSLFTSFKALCAPLAALQVRQYTEIQCLAANGGVPGHEALIYIHWAFGPFFTDLGYGGWDGFCGNLLTMIGMNDQTHCKLTESVHLFVATELCHVAGIVKGHFDSTSLNSKVEVSFGCDAAQQILTNADEASRMLGHHVLLGLVQLSPVMATEAPSAPALPGCKGARRGKLAQVTTASHQQDQGSSRAPPQGPRPPLLVSVSGNDVTTPKFKYEWQLEKAYNRPLDKLCLAFLLRRNAKLSDCPKQGTPRHEHDGKCHNTNGVDPTSLPSKRRGDDANKNPRLRQSFGQSAWK
jgi:hypothetical protein